MRKELRILGLILLIVDILALILFLGLGSNYLMKYNVHNCAKEGLYNKETSTELRNRIYDSEINNFLKEFYYLQYSVIDNTAQKDGGYSVSVYSNLKAISEIGTQLDVNPKTLSNITDMKRSVVKISGSGKWIDEPLGGAAIYIVWGALEIAAFVLSIVMIVKSFGKKAVRGNVAGNNINGNNMQVNNTAVISQPLSKVGLRIVAILIIVIDIFLIMLLFNFGSAYMYKRGIYSKVKDSINNGVISSEEIEVSLENDNSIFNKTYNVYYHVSDGRLARKQYVVEVSGYKENIIKKFDLRRASYKLTISDEGKWLDKPKGGIFPYVLWTITVIIILVGSIVMIVYNPNKKRK